jgi:tight adherence protein B
MRSVLDLQKRLAEALLHSSHTEDVDIILARNELMSEIPWMNRILVDVQGALHLKRILDQAESSYHSFKVGDVLSAGGHAWGPVYGGSHTIHCNDDCGRNCDCELTVYLCLVKRKKRLGLFLELLPDALDLVSRALSAGHCIFGSVAHGSHGNARNPSQVSSKRLTKSRTWVCRSSWHWKNLTQRIPLLDLQMCVTAIMIQRETGGNLAEILEKVAYTIRERFRIMGDLKTLTTSSRMSAWLLCGLPIAVSLVITLMNPEYMSILWKDPRGHVLIAIALFMQVTGMLIVKKILNIKI